MGQTLSWGKLVLLLRGAVPLTSMEQHQLEIWPTVCMVLKDFRVRWYFLPSESWQWDQQADCSPLLYRRKMLWQGPLSKHLPLLKQTVCELAPRANEPLKPPLDWSFTGAYNWTYFFCIPQQQDSGIRSKTSSKHSQIRLLHCALHGAAS